MLEICRTPKEAIKSLKSIKTVDDSIAFKTPQMSLIRKEKGEAYALGHLKLWLVYLQMSVNVKYKLTEDMIDLCAETILEEHWYASMGDIKIIVTDALKGRYGDFMHALSIPVVLSWFDEYFKIKFSKVSAGAESENYYHKSEESGWKIGGRTKNYLTDTERSLLK